MSLESPLSNLLCFYPVVASQPRTCVTCRATCGLCEENSPSSRDLQHDTGDGTDDDTGSDTEDSGDPGGDAWDHLNSADAYNYYNCSSRYQSESDTDVDEYNDDDSGNNSNSTSYMFDYSDRTGHDTGTNNHGADDNRDEPQGRNTTVCEMDSRRTFIALI